MTENAKAFLEKASEDEEFLERLKKAGTKEEAIALAKEKGFELTEEDLKSGTSGKQALSNDELDAVAGGKECSCVLGGGGDKGGYDNNSCGCTTYGEGLDNNAVNCDCFNTGSGDYVSKGINKKRRFFCYVGGENLGYW
ncbi:MAG: Nif11-like leader peptide family natural product precursor [Lachnospiraceae bacterium]|nr:Nif11-like leader peptide family natural product precursor [Lachnospiraceae bacterium]